jgi:hypothetical protein
MDQQPESEQLEEGRDFYMIAGIRHWSPAITADKLGISVEMLRYRRRKGRIQGKKLADNFYVFSDEQIANADLSSEKPGPKVREGSRIGRAKYVWPEDQKEGGEPFSDQSMIRIRKRQALLVG